MHAILNIFHIMINRKYIYKIIYNMLNYIYNIYVFRNVSSWFLLVI